MKLPHLNLLFFIALLTLTSCSKEETAIPKAEMTEDSSIGMRCCEDDVSDMLGNPKFHEFYDGFTKELSDPSFGILEDVDSDMLADELAIFQKCIDSGSGFDSCLRQSETLSRLIALINGYDMKQLLALLKEYDYLDNEEFSTMLIASIEQISEEQGRQLPCFHQFREEVLQALAAAALVSFGSPPAGLLTIMSGLIRAKVNYCQCLYAEYGARC